MHTLLDLLEVGHFEIYKDFHVKRGIRCSFAFGDFDLLDHECAQLVSQFPEKVLAGIDVFASTTWCGQMTAFLMKKIIDEKFPRSFHQHERRMVVLRHNATKGVCEQKVGRHLQAGKNVFIIFEHALNSMFLKSVTDGIKNTGANVAGIAVLLDRRAKNEKVDGHTVTSLHDLTSEEGNYFITSNKPCKLCDEGVSLIESLRIF